MTEPAPFDPREFRHLMSLWATSVAVVTAREKELDYGLTVNALLSVSLTPPLLLVSLARDADTTPVIERTGAFAVSFLSASQRPLSETFALAIPAPQKFSGVPVHRGQDGIALLDGATGSIECRVETVVPVADHRLVIGRVHACAAGADSGPLIFFRSRYGEADGPDRVRLPRAVP